MHGTVTQCNALAASTVVRIDAKADKGEVRRRELGHTHLRDRDEIGGDAPRRQLDETKVGGRVRKGGAPGCNHGGEDYEEREG